MYQCLLFYNRHTGRRNDCIYQSDRPHARSPSLTKTLMADSYEYPASLSTYPPHSFDRKGLIPIGLKLAYHFFITRAKIVLKELLLVGGISEKNEDMFEGELVCGLNEFSYLVDISFSIGECADLPGVVFRT